MFIPTIRRARASRWLSVFSIWAAIILNTAFGTSAWAATCVAQQQAVDILRSRIKADQDSIRMLGLGITVRDLEDASDDAEKGRKEAMRAAALSLVDGFLRAPEAALGTKSIADYELKNGLGSIGTGQANILIGRIRAQGGVKQALIPAIRKLSQISDKTSKLEYLDLLSRAASALKSTADLGASENTLQEWEALFGLAAAIAGKGDLAVSLASAIVNSAKNETQIYLMAKSINQLTSTNEAQLKALSVLTANLQRDVRTLQSLRASNCDSDLSWQIALQKQRMAAAASGNFQLYDQLLALHTQIFSQLGIRACQSLYYPGGCSSERGRGGQAANGTGSTNCPQFSAQNAQDALQVERSSHKDVCWAYNGRTLIATGSNAPDKANKPLIPLSPMALSSEMQGRGNSTARSDKSTEVQSGAGYRVTYAKVHSPNDPRIYISVKEGDKSWRWYGKKRDSRGVRSTGGLSAFARAPDGNYWRFGGMSGYDQIYLPEGFEKLPFGRYEVYGSPQEFVEVADWRAFRDAGQSG